MTNRNLKEFLDKKADEYNQPSFIEDDPVSIPHLFTRKQDIEIAGFFAAVFSWGNRTTILAKSKELLARMDMAPYDFCIDHKASDLKRLLDFKHRTFNATDLLYLVEFFKFHYSSHKSLETAFSRRVKREDETVENGLISFYHYVFSLDDFPPRTRKHIASPEKKSTCKRLNMYLRWMVRNDSRGVDFGIWKNISPAQLICPVDLHVARVAKRFGLMSRNQADWQTALELTQRLKELDPLDPVKYDFALFGMGITERY